MITPRRAKQIRRQFESECHPLLSGLQKYFKTCRGNGPINGAHGPDHDKLVGGYAILIAGEDIKLGRKAWIAAMLHSLDRFCKERLQETIQNLLNSLSAIIDGSERNEIFVAVMQHDRQNDKRDSDTQIVLQDADRLANAGPTLILRSGQHYPNIPTLELGFLDTDKKNPEGDFKNPASCLDDVKGSLEWECDSRFGLRTDQAKKIGAKYFQFLRQFLSLVRKQYKETGF